MGLIRNRKTDKVRQEALQARAHGQMVFAVKLNYPGLKLGFSGEVHDWSLMIEAIEAEGWQLANFAGAADKNGQPEALCIFRPRGATG